MSRVYDKIHLSKKGFKIMKYLSVVNWSDGVLEFWKVVCQLHFNTPSLQYSRKN